MITAISPLDGRYAKQLEGINSCFSELALMRNRLLVEVEWLIYLSDCHLVSHVVTLTIEQKQYLRSLVTEFDDTEANKIKDIEKQTKHDVKAIEYYLKAKIQAHQDLPDLAESVHFALTSEDVNSPANALMLLSGLQQHILPKLQQLTDKMMLLVRDYAASPMLSRTHGQPASPTTFGKEVGVFLVRLMRQIKQLNQLQVVAKMNGAVGNYNAHYVSYPQLDWREFTNKFISSLGLEPAVLTTQVEAYDNLAEYANNLVRINMILLDLSKDFWGYISLGYFKQIITTGQIGSSTMPHKINPIKFENAEGNLGVANALLNHFSIKLPCSRYQRDLSGSTVLRNVGVAVGHCYLAYDSLLAGLNSLEVNTQVMLNELDQRWELLTEPLQTIMRKYKIDNGYEQLKALSQGRQFTQKDYLALVQDLDLPQPTKQDLLALTPSNYLGDAASVAELLADLN